MKLLAIEENKVAVELEWDDLALLGLVCRETAGAGMFGGAGEGPLRAYVDSLAAFCEAAGMAAWPHGQVREWMPDADYTLAGFRRSFGTAGRGEEAPPAA
jgi:hypothetical protein